jgi:pyruvoyl-dependent arginine decarboxylase (PvlArgDC)
METDRVGTRAGRAEESPLGSEIGEVVGFVDCVITSAGRTLAGGGGYLESSDQKEIGFVNEAEEYGVPLERCRRADGR